MTDAAALDARRRATERQRRFRARRRASAVVVSVELSLDAVEELIARGRLHPWADEDKERIGQALSRFVEEQLCPVTASRRDAR